MTSPPGADALVQPASSIPLKKKKKKKKKKERISTALCYGCRTWRRQLDAAATAPHATPPLHRLPACRRGDDIGDSAAAGGGNTTYIARAARNAAALAATPWTVAVVPCLRNVAT